MESQGAMAIPTGRRHPRLDDLSSNMSLPQKRPHSATNLGRNTSFSNLSGSYIGSVMSVRLNRPSLSLQRPPSEAVEKKLTRTRNMSESLRSIERVGGKISRLMRIPTVKSDISKEWARLVINQYMLKNERELLAKAEDIVDFRVSDCKDSAGEFSSTYALDVKIRTQETDKTEHLSFIAKLLPANDTGRVYVFENNLLEKEIEVYFEVLPSLRELLRTQPSGDMSSVINDAIPECIYGSHNMDGAGALVFHSCKDNGFEHCNNPAGLSLTELMIAVKTLAEVHAAGRVFIAKNGLRAVQSRYPFLTKDMYSNGMLLADTSQNIETYKDFLCAGPHADMKMAKQVLKRLERYGPFQMIRGLRRQGPETLNTIIHGELWERNMMFRSVDSKCKILDWKNAKLASATLDLAFFLFSSTNYVTIIENKDKIIESYHTHFCNLLKRLTPKCAEPKLSQLKSDFQCSLSDALIQTICTFVQEMEYLERMTMHRVEEDEDEHLDLANANTLKVYEERAMNLLKAVDLDSLPDSDDPSFSDDEDESLGRTADEGVRFGIGDFDD